MGLGAAQERVRRLDAALDRVVAVLLEEQDVAELRPLALAQAGQDALGDDPGVESEACAGPQRRGDRVQERARAVGRHVGEAVSEAERAVERGAPRQVPHVAVPPLDCDRSGGRAPPGLFDLLTRQVDAGHAEPPRGERDRVPAVTARHV